MKETEKREQRIRDLESRYLSLLTSIKIDIGSKYLVISDQIEDLDVIPDNILIVKNKFLMSDISRSLETISPLERERIEQWLLRGVLKAIVPEDIITVSGDKVSIGKTTVTPQQLNQLRSEVKVTQNMFLTRLVNETVAENARKVMFESAKSTEDIKFGKIVFYLQDLTAKIHKVISHESLDEKMKKVVQLKQQKN